jgi:hypothetical protein
MSLVMFSLVSKGWTSQKQLKTSGEELFEMNVDVDIFHSPA